MIAGIKQGDLVDIKLWVHLRNKDCAESVENLLRAHGFTEFELDKYRDITPICLDQPDERSLIKARGLKYFHGKTTNLFNLGRLEKELNELSFEVWPFYTCPSAEARNKRKKLLWFCAAAVLLIALSISALSL